MDTTGIPTVTITGITNGQDFSTSDTIPVNLVASDSDGSITKHEIFVNDAKVATTGAEYTPHLITNLEEGSYRIRAKVTDNEGGTAGDVVNITAGNPANKLPDVNISNPNNGQEFSVGSTVSVDLTAIDPDGSIAKHEIFVNDSSVASYGSIYTAHQIENIEAGRYRIRARVTDNGDVSAEDIVNITVEGMDNTGPTLSIASPLNGQEFAFGSSVNVNLLASDADGNIAQHEIFVNDSLAASYASEFNAHELSNLTDGNYTIRAKVTDNGGVAVEDVVNITVRPKNIEPNVSFVSPTNGQKFDFGSTVTVNLIASDPNGDIAKHEIFLNGSSVASYGSDYTPYQISTLVAGEHSITTRVTDDEGAIAERTVNFTMGGKDERVHSDWLKRLKTLKVRLQEQPGPEHTMVTEFGTASDTRKLADWNFDKPGEAHLIAIRKLPLIPRVFDARKDDALFVLLVDGKSYVFYGFTGHFDATLEGSSRDRNKTGFIAEGQHKYRIENSGSERLLIPYEDGVLLFQDRDKNRELSARDIRAGLYPEPIESANILWHPVGNNNTLTGIQFISEGSYMDPYDEIVSNAAIANAAGGATNSVSVNAYDTFVDRIWGNPARDSLFYTVVDWSDFDKDAKEEITKTMNRLRKGV